MKLYNLKYISYSFSILSLALLITGLSSCDNIEPVAIDSLNYYFIKSGNEQKSYAGEYLQDSIRIYFQGHMWDEKEQKYVNSNEVHVRFEDITGGGSVDKQDFVLHADSSIATRWKTGTQSTTQSITARIYAPTGKYLTKLIFTAQAFQPGRWDSYSGNIYDMACDTINKLTLAVMGDKLYRQGENYFDWNTVRAFDLLSIHSVKIDRNGNIYVGTWDGNLYKSIDGGKTITECTKPITDYNGSFELIITANNRIWVSRYNQLLRFSDDGGQTWTLSEPGLNPGSQINDIFSFNDGTYITWEDYTHCIFTSVDGIHWIKGIKLQDYPCKLYVTENDDVITLNSYIQISICVSTDKGKSFIQKYSLNTSYGTAPLMNSFCKIKDSYYIGIPGAGILTSGNFMNFEVFYTQIYFRSLMVDHNGILFGTSKDLNSIYCYKPL